MPGSYQRLCKCILMKTIQPILSYYEFKLYKNILYFKTLFANFFNKEIVALKVASFKDNFKRNCSRR